MSGFVFRVTLTSRHPVSREPYFVNFECPAANLSSLVDQLNEGQIIQGEVLFTKKRREEDVFDVIRRKPFAIARPGVAHIEPPNIRIADHVGPQP